MAGLKPPPAEEPKATLALRVDERVASTLEHYAAYMHASKSWVVNETLRRLFESDKTFKAWLAERDGAVSSAAKNGSNGKRTKSEVVG